MKRILPLLVVGILVLSGLGAVAITEEHATPKPLLQPELEIAITGGLLGYTINVKNVGDETINGSLIINITTDAWIMMVDRIVGIHLNDLTLEPGGAVRDRFSLRYVIGFGPATINVQGIFMPGGWGFAGETKGFLLLFYVVCGLYTPPWE